jgi:hypothetical protein
MFCDRRWKRIRGTDCPLPFNRSATDSVISLPYLNMVRGVPRAHRGVLRSLCNPPVVSDAASPQYLSLSPTQTVYPRTQLFPFELSPVTDFVRSGIPRLVRVPNITTPSPYLTTLGWAESPITPTAFNTEETVKTAKPTADGPFVIGELSIIN